MSSRNSPATVQNIAFRLNRLLAIDHSIRHTAPYKGLIVGSVIRTILRMPLHNPGSASTFLPPRGAHSHPSISPPPWPVVTRTSSPTSTLVPSIDSTPKLYVQHSCQCGTFLQPTAPPYRVLRLHRSSTNPRRCSPAYLPHVTRPRPSPSHHLPVPEAPLCPLCQFQDPRLPTLDLAARYPFSNRQ